MEKAATMLVLLCASRTALAAPVHIAWNWDDKHRLTLAAAMFPMRTPS